MYHDLDHQKDFLFLLMYFNKEELHHLLSFYVIYYIPSFNHYFFNQLLITSLILHYFFLHKHHLRYKFKSFHNLCLLSISFNIHLIQNYIKILQDNHHWICILYIFIYVLLSSEISGISSTSVSDSVSGSPLLISSSKTAFPS